MGGYLVGSKTRSVAGSRSRSRVSARAAGRGFERLVADFLRGGVSVFVDRQVKRGALDCGDISNVFAGGHRVVVECKNTARMDLAGWFKELEREKTNNGSLVGVVVHKRHGCGDPGSQWVSLTLEDFACLLRIANESRSGYGQ